MPSHIERAAHALALDVAAADVVGALESAGIPSILLKGPAIAYWLYPDDPSGRTYTDVDLLVAPSEFEAAERVLEGMGFQRPLRGWGYRDRTEAWVHESAWERPGAPPTSVDLHRGFHGVRDWDAFWTVMDADTTLIEVAGELVRIPDAAGCALIAALHESAAFRVEQSAVDLRRAFAGLGEDVWREAARRSDDVGAMPSFVLGLTLHEEGRLMVNTLQLTPDRPVEEAILSLATTGADANRVGRAWSLQHQLAAVPGWRDRARVLLEISFPSTEHLRATQPLARRGRVGLAAARLARPVRLAVRAPSILWLLVRGHLARRGTRRSQSN